MLRCPSKECRQQEKGFRLTGQRLTYYFKDKDTFLQKFNLPMDHKIFYEKHRKHKMKCRECGYEGYASEFIDAYENPMKHFDADNLCTCGGEIWNDIEVIKPDPVLNADWGTDTDQRTVSVKVKQTVKCERCGKEYKDKM